MYDFDVNAIVKALPYIINGLKITLFVSIISSIFALIIGITIAYFRSQDNSSLKPLAIIYVEVIRNTPLLIQLYLWYKGLPNIGVNLPAIMCGILALSIYTAAYISEVLRSGINSIANEQHEAAKGLGLSQFQVFTLIVFPQAIRIIIPPLGSQFINLIKNSSLVSFIAVTDIFYVIYRESVNDFRFLEFFLVGAVIYMILTGTVAVLTNILEDKLKIQGRTVKI
ncbi:MAG: hypothetical protein A2287_06045 [Candidatus Melainabacteria bacterium RIFOXYA12_FULL_32_12]|nr:MAG: hypothetical protein A2104_07550 [Candidatus Melainabacteria bacterium GWF2_32_7]OGI22570.1 MAG: hypothetical protein A2255_06510 [Candidatus Melainabacteria bacterium RIFOXYA2_FULL_32_9]OGI28935.1 MAG: hypothetical protein A2287_06045 [Candidatus Melainabacteria bacterium RIFOXYA12_FULL_32_12]